MELDKIKGKINSLKSKMTLSSQNIWDMFFFERFLFRLAKSEYKSHFVFKGGFLLQNIVGVETRTTMDIDLKIVSNDSDDGYISKVLKDICSNNVDEIEYKLIGISNIKAETKYGGKTAKILGKFYNVKKVFNVDLGVGDIITPYAINYKYKPLVVDEEFELIAYPVETILAEKFETIISKGTNNSRSKDLLDIYLLADKEYNVELLNSAMVNTFYLRGTLYDKEYIIKILDDVYNYDNIIELYENYRVKHSFAKKITFEMCKQAAYDLFSKLKFNPKINLKDYDIELHLVRHGQDEQDKVGGWSDNHLTEKGREEIKKIVNIIDDDYDLFVSSDLIRAKETSAIINEKLNMKISYDSKYREVDNGLFKNMRRNEFNDKFPNYRFSSLKMDESYLNGESPNSFYKRIYVSFLELLENNKNKKILLFTHGGVITIILCLVKGYIFSNQLKITPQTGSVIKLK